MNGLAYGVREDTGRNTWQHAHLMAAVSTDQMRGRDAGSLPLLQGLAHTKCRD